MRVEHHYGTNIVCGYLFPYTKIKAGQKWRGSSGSQVEVIKRDDDWVTYLQANGVEHTKDAFNFQCRYCLDIGEATEVPDELRS